MMQPRIQNFIARERREMLYLFGKDSNWHCNLSASRRERNEREKEETRREETGDWLNMQFSQFLTGFYCVNPQIRYSLTSNCYSS